MSLVRSAHCGVLHTKSVREARLAAPLAFILLVAVAMCRAQGSSAPVETISAIQNLIQASRFDDGRSAIEAGLKRFPSDAALHNLLGILEAQTGRYAVAESAFRNAIRLSPGLTGAYLNLGRLYQENAGNDSQAFQKAIRTYGELLAQEPGNVEANYQSALLLAMTGAHERSLQRLSALPPNNVARPQALALRLADVAALGQKKAAEALAADLLGRGDLAEDDITGILPVLRAARQSALERQLLEALAARRLASAGTLASLGVLLEEDGQLARARDVLEQSATAAGSASAELLSRLARVAYKQRDFQGALGYLVHARDLTPENAGVHYFIGVVAIELNLVIEADKALTEAVKRAPRNPDYSYALGAVKSQLNLFTEALPYFQRYRDARPDDPKGRLALGTAYYNVKDDARARKELDSATRDRRTAAGAHYYLGRIASRAGEYDAAAKEFGLALEANPKYADAYAELGLVYVYQSRYKDAEDALHHALAIDPEGYRANMNLAVLFRRTHDRRADEQTAHFKRIEQKRAENAKLFFRTIEVRPY